MFSVTVFRVSFTSSWKMLGLAILSILLFVRLGVWQIHRATEKRQWIAMYQAQMQRSPARIPGSSVQQYQRVQVQGQARLPVTFLLDNQHHAHQFGYDVLTPLLLTDGKVVLVDHGWVLADPSRLTLPDLTGLPHHLFYSGNAYYPSSHQWVLGSGIEEKKQNMVIIETLDVITISHFLHKSVYPFIIRQSAESKSPYVRVWPIVAGSATRHIGYAVQWFVFALGVVVMYIALNLKRNT